MCVARSLEQALSGSVELLRPEDRGFYQGLDGAISAALPRTRSSVVYLADTLLGFRIAQHRLERVGKVFLR